MPLLPFPTRPSTRAADGVPMRADPCRCAPGARHEDTCVFCGHLDAATIDRTWATQARLLGLPVPKREPVVA